MICNPRLLLAFIFTFAAGCLFAQAPAEDGRLHFRTFGWQVSPDDLFYEVAGKDAKIAVTESARSGFYSHPAGPRIVFYRLIPGPEGKLIREEAAVADVSAAGSWPLLLFLKSPEDAKRFRIVALSDDLKSFPAPSCRFLNLTPVALQATFGDQRVTVASRGIQQLDPRLKSTDTPETRYTTISVGTPQGPRLLYGNNWVVRPAQRTLVFIFAQDAAMQVHRIVDDIGQYAPPAPPR